MKKYDVFISHSSKDLGFANKLCKYLENNGISCWIAPRDVPAGTDYAEVIYSAISNSSVLLLIYSKNVLENPKHVMRELDLADKKDLYIIPYKIDSAEISSGFEYHLTNCQWIQSTYEDNNFDYVIEEIQNRITQGEVEHEVKSKSRNEKKKRRKILKNIITTAIVLVAGVIVFKSFAYISNFRRNEPTNTDIGTMTELTTMTFESVSVVQSQETEKDDQPETEIHTETETTTNSVTMPTFSAETIAITTANTESKEELYSIHYIDSAEWKEMNYTSNNRGLEELSVYDSENNIFYYFKDGLCEELFSFNLNTNTVGDTIDSDTIKNNVANLLSEETIAKDNLKDKIEIYGALWNPYNKKPYIYGTYDRSNIWLIDIDFSEFISAPGYAGYPYFFASENFFNSTKENFVLSTGHKPDTRPFYRYYPFLFCEYNDNYYMIECFVDSIWGKGEYKLLSVENIYTMERKEIATLADESDAGWKENLSINGSYSFNFFNDFIYMKDRENNIYKIDLETLTKEQTVSPNYIGMKGGIFLSENKCTGLQMTNNGGFITFDHTDNKIKYVEPNF